MGDADENKAGSVDDALVDLAREALDQMKGIADYANAELGRPATPTHNSLAQVNTLTSDLAVKNLREMAAWKREDLIHLASEPVIARVTVLDEAEEPKTIYITRATPHGPSPTGAAVASYRSPMGRLAAAAVGRDHDVVIKGSIRNFEVVSRAALRPRQLTGQWDSVPTELLRADAPPLTISSLRSLLASVGAAEADLTFLDSLLAEGLAGPVVSVGLRRSVIEKMALRDRPLLDEYQDEIFRLPLDTRLVILGPPGTGKTTTLIKRLGLKLDIEYLEPDERAEVERTEAGVAEHPHSWMLFTPTELLKLYVKEAFAREGIAASDLRIQTWADFRKAIARSDLGILRTSTGRGAILREQAKPLLLGTESSQVEWYEDFSAWQTSAFWSDLNDSVERLQKDVDPDVVRMGSRLARIVGGARRRVPSAFMAMDDLANEIGALASRLRSEVDDRLRRRFAEQLGRDHALLDDLLAYIRDLGDPAETDDLDDLENDDDDEEDVQPSLSREAAFEAYRRAVRARAMALATKRNIGRRTRNGRILEWLGDRIPDDAELVSIGERLRAVASLRRFSNPLRRFIGQIPARYRRFRRDRQSEGRWYATDAIAPTDLSPLELDLVELEMLRTARGLLSDRGITRRIDGPRFTTLKGIMGLWRNQIVVDEATDFSPIQLGCMAALCDPALNSFVACGDFNQRITSWGSRSVDELRWVLPDADIRSIVISYRHSRQLSELAHAIASLGGRTADAVALPKDVDNEGFDPVLGLGLGGEETARWIAARIIEIERLTGTLPSIAVLMNREEDVVPMADNLRAALADQNIGVAACRDGKVVGQDQDVRVFDVQHIKGLEFEAAFFVDVERLVAGRPDLFDKFLYVGATRAATYFGLTSGDNELPDALVPLRPLFKHAFPAG